MQRQTSNPSSLLGDLSSISHRKASTSCTASYGVTAGHRPMKLTDLTMVPLFTPGFWKWFDLPFPFYSVNLRTFRSGIPDRCCYIFEEWPLLWRCCINLTSSTDKVIVEKKETIWQIQFELQTDFQTRQFLSTMTLSVDDVKLLQQRHSSGHSSKM